MNKNEKIMYEGIPYFHPGSLLKEILKARHIEQKDLSKRTNISEKHLSQLLSSQVSLSVEIAQKISLVLDENPETWINMQTKYDIIQEKIKCAEELSKHVELLKKFPIKDMVKYGLIKPYKEKWKNLFQLISFLGFGDPKNMKKLSTVMYRKLKTPDTEEATTVLIKWGEKIALSRNTTYPYNKKICEQAIKNIRQYMQKPLDDNLLNNIQQELEKAGVLFVFTPKLKNTSVSGLSYKLDQHPVIHLTDRNKQVDTFWFSLFHELKHVLDDDISEINKTINKTHEMEEQADNYAREIIIPNSKWISFLNTNFNISVKSVNDFANDLVIPAACIIGRLQKEKIITYRSKLAHELKEKNLVRHFDNICFSD